MVSHSLAMEALRYLAAKRQVADAIRVAGIRQGTRAVAVVLFASEAIDDLLKFTGWARDDSVLELGGKNLEVLGVTKDEASTIPIERQGDLVLEKVALLDALR